MTKQILKIIFFLIIIIILIGLITHFRFLAGSSTAQAAGELTIDWGVPADLPLFQITNLFPGQSISKTVIVKNDSASNQNVAVRAVATSDTDNLASQLLITISQDSQILYGPITVSEFFTASSGTDGIPLTSLDSNITTNYAFNVLFNPLADNNFQNKIVIFDLSIGINIPIPAECQEIKFDKIIYGTPRSEILRVGKGNNLIFGLEGSDIIYSGNGNDCLVSGPGSDIIFGGNGDDYLLGGEVNDVLFGGSGADQLFGGNGADILFGENHNDRLIGGSGNDTAFGGSGSNYCEAELKFQCQR